MIEKDYKEYLNKISPILRDKIIWDAFTVLLEYEQACLINLLYSNQNTEELIRINAKLTLLEKLKKYRDKSNDTTIN
jgi:hypothetical protein